MAPPELHHRRCDSACPPSTAAAQPDIGESAHIVTAFIHKASERSFTISVVGLTVTEDIRAPLPPFFMCSMLKEHNYTSSFCLVNSF